MAKKVKDPVCGMMIDESSARCQGEYCFCSDECYNKFVVNPGRYINRT